jgi:hypothetical protein
MSGEIEYLTGLVATERKRVFKWVASLEEETLIKLFQAAVKRSYQIKAEHPELDGKVAKYCAFVRAARDAGWDSLQSKGYRVAGEKQFSDFAEIRRAKAAAVIRKGRSPLLRKRILAYWGEILELKAEGIGFRPIADYLLKNRRIRVSASYLAKLWIEVAPDGTCK